MHNPTTGATRTVTAAALGSLLLVLLSGCQSSITQARVEKAMVTSFGHLFVLQQQQRGITVDAADLHPTADCARQNRRSTATGPGNDWVCNMEWRTTNATTGGAAYSLSVKPDGCFTADGDGPADLNGDATITDVDGEVVVNPLWAFDTCFALR